jgi:tetratricopeptide (TPR) repeat protein
MAAGRQGHYEQAEILLTEAVNLRRQINQNTMDDSLARTLNNLAIVVKYLGEYERATALFQECFLFQQAQGNQLGVASAASNLGKLAMTQGDLKTAETYLHHSLTIRQQLGDQIGTILAIGGLADLMLQLGQYQQSIQFFAACQTQYEAANFSLTSENLRQREEGLAILKQKVSPAEFDRAWQTGSNLNLVEATALALAAFPLTPSPSFGRFSDGHLVT